MTLLRNIAAIAAGLVVGSAYNMAVILGNTTYLYPMPKHVSMDDPKAFGEYIRSLPPAAYLVVAMAHFGQVVIGSLVANGLSPENHRWTCSVIGALTMMGSVVNNLSLPVPKWTWIEIPLYPVVTWGVVRWLEQASSRVKKE